MISINTGVWPTTITPMTDDNRIDYNGLEELIEWYLSCGVNGIFTVCMSSEVFFLSKEERIEMARFVSKLSRNRLQVVASGNLSRTIDEQIEEVKAMADTGIDAVVLLTNQLAAESENDDQWKRKLEQLLANTPGIALGLYECPYPYKRFVNSHLIKWCVSTGRFFFLKDTTCSLEMMKERLDAIDDSSLRLFNANAPTLLQSLELGAAGYSGVMANFHPQLYVWLTRFWRDSAEEITRLHNFLGLASLIELQLYPVNAKYFLQLEGLNIRLNCRCKDPADFDRVKRIEVEQLHALSTEYLNEFSIR